VSDREPEQLHLDLRELEPGEPDDDAPFGDWLAWASERWPRALADHGGRVGPSSPPPLTRPGVDFSARNARELASWVSDAGG
jgi:hypothetical protein